MSLSSNMMAKFQNMNPIKQKHDNKREQTPECARSFNFRRKLTTSSILAEGTVPRIHPSKCTCSTSGGPDRSILGNTGFIPTRTNSAESDFFIFSKSLTTPSEL